MSAINPSNKTTDYDVDLAVHVASSLDYQVLSESAQTENHAENPG
jgi:hypothetical protein